MTKRLQLAFDYRDMNLLEIFLRPIKEWVEQSLASLPRRRRILISIIIVAVIVLWSTKDQVLQVITSTPAPKIINFKTFTVNRTLSGNEYAGEGIKQIKAVIEDPVYCPNAQLVLRQPKQHDPPGSFLTTGVPGKWTDCNTLPIEFYLTKPVRSITVDFRGAAVPYELNVYDKSRR
jgi:hypothetical protein